VALIAITSMLFDVTSKVHWIARALWIVSMLSAFFSVFSACRQQRVIGRIQHEDPQYIQEWMIAESEPHSTPRKSTSPKGSTSPKTTGESTPSCKATDPFPKPRISVVLLLSVSRTFLDIALWTYIIGLAVYLGCVWRNNLDADATQFDIRNICIFFWTYTAFCIFAYSLLKSLSSYRPEDWIQYLKDYQDNRCPKPTCKCVHMLQEQRTTEV
jgi:hypothetical protein